MGIRVFTCIFLLSIPLSICPHLLISFINRMPSLFAVFAAEIFVVGPRSVSFLLV